MSGEAGVWMSFLWDWNPADVRPHASEVDALRHVNSQGYGQVLFVPFGMTVDEADRDSRRVRSGSSDERGQG